MTTRETLIRLVLTDESGEPIRVITPRVRDQLEQLGEVETLEHYLEVAQSDEQAVRAMLDTLDQVAVCD